MTRESQTPAISVFGWGIVAPGARDVAAFRALLERGESVLRPSADGRLGHGLFVTGDPDFDFERCRPWIEAHHGEARFSQLQNKLGDNAQFAIGALVQALESNPGLEQAVRAADTATHIYIGSGVGDLPESFAASAALAKATRVWNRFWAQPARCEALRQYREQGQPPAGAAPPVDPATLEPDSEERLAASLAWDAFWADRSEALAAFEARYREIEARPVGTESDAAALNAIKARQRLHRKLLDEAGCPTPPWNAVDPRLLWAIQNVPAAEISILLGTHGPAWAPVGACSTFGIALKLGHDAIARGEAKIAIVGTTDPRPNPALVAAFHRGRLVPGNGGVSRPLTDLLGTHVSGGACLWVLGDRQHLAERGLAPVGPSVRAVELSSDAYHIITPSVEGPKVAIRSALAAAGAGGNVAAWDMHATGTPGDLAELDLLREFVSDATAISARKGLFGHGMSNAGGWELTALALGLAGNAALGTGLEAARLHPLAAERARGALVCTMTPLGSGPAVKVMLGIGGITACAVLEP
jgi:3-oxoacyl-(acyl-carrier-protein) synthase